jgi:hypothetical protein
MSLWNRSQPLVAVQLGQMSHRLPWKSFWLEAVLLKVEALDLQEVPVEYPKHCPEVLPG